jgi:hypothetical protein
MKWPEFGTSVFVPLRDSRAARSWPSFQLSCHSFVSFGLKPAGGTDVAGEEAGLLIDLSIATEEYRQIAPGQLRLPRNRASLPRNRST